MPIHLHFKSDERVRVQHDWTYWWHHKIDSPMVVIIAYERQGVNFIPQHSGWDEDKRISQVDENSIWFNPPRTTRTGDVQHQFDKDNFL